MRPEDSLGDAAGLEQREAQEHRVANAGPDGGRHIPVRGDGAHQHRIDRHTHDDQERLKAQRKQRPQVILSHLPPFPVHHGSHGQRRKGRDGVDFHHAAVDHHKDADGQRVHRDPYEQTLEPKPQQRPDLHLHHPRLQICNDFAQLQRRVRRDYARRRVDHALRQIKHAHDDIPGVGHDHDGTERFEHPFEEHPGFEVMHVVLFHHQLQKLHRHHDGEDHARDGQNHLIGQAADHAVHAAVPRLRRRADLSGDSGHLGVYLIEQPLKVSHDAAY